MGKSVNCFNLCYKANDSEQNFKNKQSFITPLFHCFNGKKEFHVSRNGRRVNIIGNRFHFFFNSTNKDCLNHISDNLKKTRTRHISFASKVIVKDILNNCDDLKLGRDMHTDKNLIKYFDSIMNNNNLIKRYDKVIEDQIKHNSGNNQILKDRLSSVLSRKEAAKADRYDLEDIAKCFINESAENPKKMRFTHYFIRYLGTRGYLKVGQYKNIRKIFKNELKVIINEQIKNYKFQEKTNSDLHANDTQIEKLPKIGENYILLKSYEQLLIHNSHRVNTCSRLFKSSSSNDSFIIEAHKICNKLNQNYINILTNFTAQTNDIIDPNPEQFVQLEQAIMSIFELINTGTIYTEIQHDIDNLLEFLTRNFLQFIEADRDLLIDESVANIFLDIMTLNKSLIENKKIDLDIKQKLEETVDSVFLKEIINSKKTTTHDEIKHIVESRMVDESPDNTEKLASGAAIEIQQHQILVGCRNDIDNNLESTVIATVYEEFTRYTSQTNSIPNTHLADGIT